MPRRSVGISLLLTTAVLLTIMLPNSQGLTTITQTFTSPVVVTSTLNSTIGSSFAATTKVQMYTYTTPFLVEATGGSHACTYKAFHFSAGKGDQISGQVRSSIEISFYIMTASDYQTWVSSNVCNVGSSIFGRQKVTTLLIDMVAPFTGDYDLLVVNNSVNSAANVNIVFVGVTQTVTTVTVPILSRKVIVATLSTTVEQAVVTSVGIGALVDQYWLLIVAAIIFGLAVFALQRRKSQKPTPPYATGISQVPQPQADRKFCGHCGAELPLNALFCDDCGEPYEDD